MLPALLALASATFRLADVDLTPTEPLPLGGYTERGAAVFEPGGEPLMARALVLEAGSKRLVWLAVEALTVPESLVARVRSQAPTGTDVVLSATHTHCAPDSQMLNERMKIPVPGVATYRARQLEWTAGRLSEAIRRSLQSSAVPLGRLEARIAETAGLNRARRAGDRPDARAYRISAGGAPLFQAFAAHPVLLGPEHRRLDPEWPGWLMREAGGIVLTGAIGDVSPVPPSGPRADLPRLFAQALRSALDASPPRDLGSGVAWTFEPIPLGTAVPHPEFAKANRVPEALARLAVSRFAPPTAELIVLRLGRALVVGIPGEPTSAVGRRLAEVGRQKGFDPVVVASHVGGWIGYILTSAEYAEGGYEATLAFHGPGLADRLEGAVERAVQRISQMR
ncbi:MAG: hypothetical protein N2109_04990 [Fimbriimonadales bacterium]|nr:hypothetical protein [Fimbriimonadales bacterium]